MEHHEKTVARIWFSRKRNRRTRFAAAPRYRCTEVLTGCRSGSPALRWRRASVRTQIEFPSSSRFGGQRIASRRRQTRASNVRFDPLAGVHFAYVIRLPRATGEHCSLSHSANENSAIPPRHAAPRLSRGYMYERRRVSCVSRSSDLLQDFSSWVLWP
jgi:hypothetical protein